METESKRFVRWLLIYCLATAAGELHLTTSPAEISLGVTDSLTVNCTFLKDGTPDMATIISLFISRKSDNSTQGSGDELASVNRYVHHVTTILPEFNITSGNILTDDVSYLELTWLYPTERQSGIYICTAMGIDSVGHTVELTTQATVTARLPERVEILAKIQELNENLKNAEQKLSDLYSSVSRNLSQYTVSQSQRDNAVNKTLAVLETFEKEVQPLVGLFKQSAFYPFNLTYGGHVYRVLRAPIWGGEDAVALCESYGTRLIEIDDAGEFSSVQTFLNQHSRLTILPVAGRLVNNQWIKQYSNEPMFDQINLLMPLNISATNDCRILTSGPEWSMQPVPCKEILPIPPYRQVNAICESKA